MLEPNVGTAAGGVAMRGVSKTYDAGATEALREIDLTMEPGDFTAVIGPSGCGKTTLLKIIGDIIEPTAGLVSIDGEPARRTREARRIGYAFQSPVLLPWRSVADNILLPYDIGSHRADRRAARERLPGLLDVIGLAEFADALPSQLSVGMRARVGIAQALIYEPDILLMDEPFAALDELTRMRMSLHLLQVWERLRTSVVFVTHHIEEAVLLSNRIVVMSPRPARIRRIVEVDLPRPRGLETRQDDRFHRLAEGLLEEFHQLGELEDAG